MYDYEKYVYDEETVEELDYDRDEFIRKFSKNIEKTQKNY